MRYFAGEKKHKNFAKKYGIFANFSSNLSNEKEFHDFFAQ